MPTTQDGDRIYDISQLHERVVVIEYMDGKRSVPLYVTGISSDGSTIGAETSTERFLVVVANVRRFHLDAAKSLEDVDPA